MSAESQAADDRSMLNLYRSALRLQRAYLRHNAFEWTNSDTLAFTRGEITCVVNTSPRAIAAPSGTVLISSEPFDDGMIPPDAAAWILTATSHTTGGRSHGTASA
jgi:alpha-glucosidase